MILTCPADMPCFTCKALVPKGVQGEFIVVSGRELWFHLACARELIEQSQAKEAGRNEPPTGS